MNLAIVGATGLVGAAFLKTLEDYRFPITSIIFLASAKSAGKALSFMGKSYIIEELTPDSFNRPLDIALFSAGGSVSKTYAPIAASKGVLAIDNSSAWRMDESVPLVVPEVNPEAAFGHRGIIANPNCSTIQCMLPLKALHEAYGLKRVVYSTYQAVSGSGVKGIEDLRRGLKGEPPLFYPHPIADNCLPHIDSFLESGYTKEEEKMVNETRKILGLPSLAVTATCVRVPVSNGHGVSVNAELDRPCEAAEARRILAAFPGIVLADDPKNNVYPLAKDALGRDAVLVGRVRKDESVPSGINFWCTADNVRKGAASNAVQIAQLFIQN